ncbi:MAG: NAD(P)H-hydrate dehydratase [Pseudomonadota bacterium]
MTKLLTAAQMRTIEQAAIDSGEVTGLELMERAGRGVVEAIFEEWPELRATSHRAVVLCGPGNNGGDGFVVARLLKDWGWEVEVFLHGDPSRLPPDARVNYDRWGELGEVNAIPNQNLDYNPWATDLVIDAIFGTGLGRGIDFDIALSAMLPDSDLRYESDCPKIVAIDLPTGLCSDSGRELEGDGFWADLTVSFHRLKLGHLLSKGPFTCGKLTVADIGLPKMDSRNQIATVPSGEASGWMLGGLAVLAANRKPLIDEPAKLVIGHAGLLTKWSETYGQPNHKYSHGHALILTGGPGKTGAARLAARGALRIGAGLVTLACPPNTLSEVANHITAIMCRALDGVPGLRELLEDDRLNALCLGPGMGLGADTQALVIEALKSKRPTVLDADALSRFERNPDVLLDLTHEKTVLTPHAGEFKRLFPDIADKLNAPATTGPAYSKVDATREAAKRAGCTVLFKGPDTVIADQTGRCSINSSAYERAAPWLATAGAGDVLAGYITGLLARGFGPMQAAETAAWLHTECALSFGPGLIAEDLPEELPKVFTALFAKGD